MWSREQDTPITASETNGLTKKKNKVRTIKPSFVNKQEVQYHAEPEVIFNKNLQANSLADNEIEEYKEAFTTWDKNNTGTVRVDQLPAILRCLGHDIPRDQIDDLLEDILDEDEDFLTLMLAVTNGDEEADLREAYLVLDPHNKGDIGKRELHTMMLKLGHQLTDDEIRGMIKEADTTGNGRISYSEFVTMMTGKKT